MDTGRLKNLLFIKALAWGSWVAAHIGGWALAATFLGGWISGLVGLFPDPVAPTVFVLGVAWMLLDAFLDLEPNRPAVWLAILLPSAAQAVNGEVGRAIHDWGTNLNRIVSAKMGDLLGEGSLTTIAIVFIGVALIVARRVVKRSKAAKNAAAGMPVGVPAGAQGRPR